MRLICRLWLWLIEIVIVCKEGIQTIGRRKLNVSFLQSQRGPNLLEPLEDQKIQMVDSSLMDFSSEMEDVYNKAYMLE